MDHCHAPRLRHLMSSSSAPGLDKVARTPDTGRVEWDEQVATCLFYLSEQNNLAYALIFASTFASMFASIAIHCDDENDGTNVSPRPDVRQRRMFAGLSTGWGSLVWSIRCYLCMLNVQGTARQSITALRAGCGHQDSRGDTRRNAFCGFFPPSSRGCRWGCSRIRWRWRQNCTALSLCTA